MTSWRKTGKKGGMEKELVFLWVLTFIIIIMVGWFN